MRSVGAWVLWAACSGGSTESSKDTASPSDTDTDTDTDADADADTDADSDTDTGTPAPSGISACVVNFDEPDPLGWVWLRPATASPPQPIRYALDAAGCVVIEQPPGSAWELQATNQDESCFSLWTYALVPEGALVDVLLDYSYLCAGG